MHAETETATVGNFEAFEQLAAENPHVLFSLTPQKNSAFHISSKLDHQPFASELLHLCPPFLTHPNSKGDMPLHVAARSGHSTIVKALISFGKLLGDVVEGGRGGVGESPAYVAAERGWVDIFRKIMKATPQFVEKGPDAWTPLHATVIRGHRGGFCERQTSWVSNTARTRFATGRGP
ncbi:hypothetical protein AMTR_s00037p00073010 [Amborella trichopoda]|uniref:Uncharacterized protein n=1 Tax=Amborella trichopoda TaxID=13333 RepID=U5D4D4_AMBTC|nr:hypothetical protein AMTR_s00037p00073010 [Amborella trichopoda]